MPAYYDEKAKSWYCKFYYTNYTGAKRQKKKRGFKLQREVKEWERNFLETQQADLSMSFENFVTIYNEDMKHRLREHTFFGKMAVSEITPAHVRKWQNGLIAYRDNKEKPYSDTYLRTINNQLAAIMNYAVRYYNLKDNPCRKAGTIGKDHADEMNFWTTEEFKLFLEKVPEQAASICRIPHTVLYRPTNRGTACPGI